jgi:hypothetical protein
MDFKVLLVLLEFVLGLALVFLFGSLIALLSKKVFKVKLFFEDGETEKS